MARVSWDSAGEKLYHTGIDRGMLYIDDAAVPWSGLVSVSESPSGGDAQPYYIDGVKVLNSLAGEDYGATVQAYAAPLEFAPCAGRLRLSTGLFVTDQPKKGFSFSYRTIISNDLVGLSFAYKIHIVYNALAQISDFQHVTISGDASASVQSWAITTIPVSIDGYRPTAHLTFDTRLVDTDDISQIEAILYGNDSNDPRLPTADELVTILNT